ncbi:sporulation membrane protein YtaF [Neobacillus mesonae]|uniref:sporulation membrane protein YtaF n=1 Tax=Neobacillus mesonae TaxID=1193713 RepID=UPI00257485F6|nr:sporulation membrane protein YtaF [Neobacillus mesonae]MED4203757.1 sporulation membrane protein YtaF [Neobacillus mesonae]
MSWLIIVAFAASSSIDNLGIGISYGVRKIRISLGANLLIAVICYLMSLAGITFGLWMARILPGIFPVVIGALLLLIIGIRIILLAAPRQKTAVPEVEGHKRYETETWGPAPTAPTIKHMLKNPETADADGSGEIGWGEAVVLGVALSANALTNGLGAGLLGFSPHAISLTAALGSLITVWAGVRLGVKLADVRIGRYTLGQFGTIISGIIIVVIAITAFF